MMKLQKSFLALALLGLCSCSQNRHQSHNEVSEILREIQVELSELKYQMNTHQSELAFIEDKIQESDKALSNVKKQTQGETSITRGLRNELENLRKQVVSLEKQGEKAASDIKLLSKHADQTTTALTQYKKRISSVESGVNDQTKRLDEVKKLRGAITSLSSTLGDGTGKTYRVVAGDTLEKIAHKNGTTVAELKRYNHLTYDRINVGQELNIPK